MKYRTVLGLCAVGILMGTLNVQAQLQTAGIMRDEFALALTPSIKSAGMGGAYVGVDGPMSMNPASLSSVENWEGTLSYGLYDHDSGPMTHRGRADFIFKDPFIGGYNRVMADGFTNDGEDPVYLAGNPLIDFDSVTLGTQYGRNLFDWWAVGFGGYPYEQANVDLITPGGTIKSEAFSQLGSVQLGTLFRPCQYFNIGAQFIYIKDRLQVDLPNGTHWQRAFQIHYFAFGASAKPIEGTLLALDYWNGKIHGAASLVPFAQFNQNVDRWNFGIQQKVCNYCDLRLGYNNGGLTTGFSFHINDNMDLDYAYANKALVDKEEIFGDTQYHALAFTYKFK